MASEKDKSGEAFQTRGKFAGYFYEFEGDDEVSAKECVVEVTEIRDNGEIELHWQMGETGRYLDFRMSDLRRALKEAAPLQGKKN